MTLMSIDSDNEEDIKTIQLMATANGWLLSYSKKAIQFLQKNLSDNIAFISFLKIIQKPEVYKALEKMLLHGKKNKEQIKFYRDVNYGY